MNDQHTITSMLRDEIEELIVELGHTASPAERQEAAASANRLAVLSELYITHPSQRERLARSARMETELVLVLIAKNKNEAVGNLEASFVAVLGKIGSLALQSFLAA